jgi:hypothetical protein
MLIVSTFMRQFKELDRPTLKHLRFKVHGLAAAIHVAKTVTASTSRLSALHVITGLPVTMCSAYRSHVGQVCRARNRHVVSMRINRCSFIPSIRAEISNNFGGSESAQIRCRQFMRRKRGTAEARWRGAVDATIHNMMSLQGAGISVYSLHYN